MQEHEIGYKMKTKVIAIVVAIVGVAILVVVGILHKEGGKNRVKAEIGTSAHDKKIIEELKNYHKEFFDLSTENGLCVFVCENSQGYRCKLYAGYGSQTIGQKELSSTGSVTVEEMKLILSTYDVPEEKINVRSYVDLTSSYFNPDSVLNDTEKMRNLFFD